MGMENEYKCLKMRNLYFYVVLVAVMIGFLPATLNGQQLPNSDFEDWSGAAFDGNIQPANWNVSNVTQLGFKFNFAYREAGRTGYGLKVQSQEVGAAGITEVSPGYVVLGQPWVYVPSLPKVNQATAGTYGGINWTYRPDTMQVWIRRTGDNVLKEDFNLLYYAWSGTAQGSSYRGKNGSCTSVSKTDEESDIRQALDANGCTTTKFAKQIAEGWVRGRKVYNDWTCINVPIYYMNSDVPEKCNIIFSASNYPNFNATTGLYNGDALYVDDVRLIYSSKIQSLYIGNKRWNAFNPDSREEQIYSVGNITEIPEIYAMRGEGSLTNSKGTTVNFPGRRLSESEMTVTPGTIDGEPTLITVKAEDGSTVTVYKIRFVSKPSDNARLKDIQVNGVSINGFNGYVTEYSVGLPYGTVAAPKVTFTQSEEKQVVTSVQPSSVTGQSVIKVVAPDGVATMTYTITFFVKELEDNSLQGINVNGHAVQGFQPAQTIYRVELPLGTTDMPQVEAVSAYPEGAQTVTYLPPTVIDGGQYQIVVTAPGNPTAKTYKLNFKITASTNSALQDLQVEGGFIAGFDPQQTTYYVTLPLGTKVLPDISWIKGDEYQTVIVEEGGLDGTTRITVTAASGAQTVYKIVFSTEKSNVDWLDNIYVGGVALDGFKPETTVYDYVLPLGTTVLPDITYDAGDEYQTIVVTTNGVEGTTRITVTANDGTTSLYQIRFSVLKATDATLNMIYVDGVPLEGFDPARLEYTVSLPQGTTTLPVVTWEQHDEWQTVTYREAAGLNGEARIMVRPQEGNSQTYIVRFALQLSGNTDLQMIYLNGTPLEGFDAALTGYTVNLPLGVSVIPVVTWTTMEQSQKVMAISDGDVYTLRVTAEDGSTKTYKLVFVVQKSENAFLRMIYLDGTPLEGFQSDRLSGYTVMLTEERCPLITVDKEAGQQVTVMAPAAEGNAVIEVRPETGASNRYVISFVKRTSADILLQDILLDGVGMEGFDAYTNEYIVPYSGQLPQVAYVGKDDIQTVRVMQEKNVVKVLVSNDADELNIYVLTFVRIYSADASLRSILLDGKALADYDAAVTDYTVGLPARAVLPVVTYEKNSTMQTVTAGQIDEYTYVLTVTAEDGETVNAYTLHFDVDIHTDVTLDDIQLDGVSLEGFAANTFNYTVTIQKGVALPLITYTKKETQAVVVSESALSQQILVIAESGATALYTVNYVETISSNALLEGILLDGKPLAGFRTDVFHYTDTLAWRTAVVPSITPVLAVPGQTVTVHYSAVNDTTLIHVMAEDKVTTADYTIAFPVHRSANTMLETVMLQDIDFDFHPEQTEYTIVLPYQMNTAPMLIYEKQETEQQVIYISAPVMDTTKLVVTAENGNIRTYRFVFVRTLSDKPNRLQSLFVNGVEVDLAATAMKVDDTHFEVVVPMPYGTEAFKVTCLKSFDEQTCFLQPGGTLHPSVITLKANRANEPDVVYTVIPQIVQHSPAVLDALAVDAVPVLDFETERFNYIVNVGNASSMPIVTYTQAADVQVTVNEQTGRLWRATVTVGDCSNVYTLYFHYPADVIPNADFTEWTKAAKNTAADKPVAWQVAADYADSYGFPKAYTGKEVLKAESAVVFKTENLSSYLDWGGGGIPAVATLGNIAFKWGTGGSTTSDFGGGIPFHNTPDAVEIHYWYKEKSGNGALFAFRFFDNYGNETSFDYITAETTSEYVTYLHPLATDALNVQSMNIAVNATNQNKGVKAGAELYVDRLRFIYNSRLAALSVNGQEAVLSGNRFTYVSETPERLALPVLTFTGEVADQSQWVVWGEETRQDANVWRSAQIRNYAEDGTYTDYELVVTRPLSQINTLAGIEVGGKWLDNFSADVADYTVLLPYASTVLPDVMPVAATDLQTITMNFEDSVLAIQVMPEYGEAKTYTITFVEQRSSDTTLKSLVAEGLVFDALQHEYILNTDVMPAITFEKQSDGQWVVLDNGVLDITAEDGTKGQYRIVLQPREVHTSGQLLSLLADDVELQGFSKEVYRYTAARPALTSFVREFVSDSVVQVLMPDSVMWTVYGNDVHTYTLVYPSLLSSNANLAALLVNGEPYAEFLPMQSDYVIRTNESFDMQFVSAEPLQVVNTRMEGAVLVADVTAADGTQRQAPYTVVLQPELSDVAALSMIRLNGIDLENFAPDNLSYVVELPCTDPKVIEPQVPDITYVLGQQAQTVVVETAPLGGTSYVVVTSEDGTMQRQYELKIIAEPSHNTSLDGIFVNGKPVAHFVPDIYLYSAQVSGTSVDIQYSSADLFQTVTHSVDEEGLHVLTVTAQDGVSVSQYRIAVYQEALSNNAFLQNILLDGQPFSAFDEDCTDFDAKQLRYNIRIGVGVLLPDLYVQLQEVGQTWQILSGVDTDTVRVVALDGTTVNDYVLNFVRVKSDNATLAMIYLDGVELSSFEPTRTQYDINLPVGTMVLPVVDVQKGEASQTYTSAFDGNVYTCTVTAEDGSALEYRLNFTVLRSDADTLLMVYEDGIPVNGFRPERFHYVRTLPVGVRTLPELSYEQADRWQTVVVDTVPDAITTIYQITVLSESGRKNVYTFVYQLQKSSVDTLQAILVNNQELEDFSAYRMDYTFYLPAGSLAMPKVGYIAGDRWQEVEVVTSPDGICRLIVMAENGAQRVYTVHFVVALSDNTELQMIACGGQDIANFDGAVLTYNIALPYGTTMVPVITFVKAEEGQNVTLEVEGWTARLKVFAPDGQTERLYTLHFTVSRSANALLQAIALDGMPLAEFRPEVSDYEVVLPYGTSVLPEITWTVGDEQQQVERMQVGQFMVVLAVTAGNGEDMSEYRIAFALERSPVNTLSDLAVRGTTVEGFSPDINEYHFTYPAGTAVEEFFTMDDVTYVLADEEATAVLAAQDASTITLLVTAPNGNVNAYVLKQEVALYSNALLADLQVNGQTLPGFLPEIFDYEYLLLEGTVMPELTAKAQDERAQVDITLGEIGGITYIYCTAEDGTEYEYTVLFRYADINTGQDARNGDVLFKHIPGTNQYQAVTIRQNVQVAVYDISGKRLVFADVPVSDPNTVLIVTDADGHDFLVDVTSPSEGAQITVDRYDGPLFYVFFQNGKTRIASGKFMLVR